MYTYMPPPRGSEMVYSKRRLYSAFILLMRIRYIYTDISCSHSRVYLTATDQSQILVSSEYEHMQDDTANCIWVIQTESGNDVIEFQLLHWFAPATSSCSADYLLTRDGIGSWKRPLRYWCKNSQFTDDVVKSGTSTLYVELVSGIYWEERVVFVLAYWTAPKDIEVVVSAEIGVVNYALIVLSAILGVVLAGGFILLLVKEYSRCRHTKNVEFREKLNVRRKGISGRTFGRSMSVDTMSENTSYIQLSETPTSAQCSSGWSVSPIRACSSETPTSGNTNV